MPPPGDLTAVEWTIEMVDLQNHLSVELRAILPEVKSRSKPLAKPSVSVPFAHLLKSKFTISEGDQLDRSKMGQNDEDKIQAVRMNMFGSITRQKHEWHPSSTLCKRFNTPDPYSQSNIQGVPHFQKDTKRSSVYDLTLLPSTETELADRKAEREQDDNKADKLEEEFAEQVRPPIDLFKSIFASDDDDEQVEEEADKEQADTEQNGLRDELERAMSGAIDRLVSSRPIGDEQHENSAPISDERPVETDTWPILTVMDLIPDPAATVAASTTNVEIYGPKMPPRSDPTALPAYSAIVRHKHDKEEKKRKKSKHNKVKRKKKKEKRKSRKKSDDSDSTIEIVSD